MAGRADCLIVGPNLHTVAVIAPTLCGLSPSLNSGVPERARCLRAKAGAVIVGVLIFGAVIARAMIVGAMMAGAARGYLTPLDIPTSSFMSYVNS